MKRKPERAKDALRKRRVAKILAILRKVDAQPRTWGEGKSAWIKHVAAMHGIASGTVYRWLQKYDKRGIAGLEHRKLNAGKPKTWDSAALSWWIGQALLPANRKIDLKALYQALIIEAGRRGWHVGGWSSATWWLRNKSRSLIENKS